jgi:hypothetical protein
VKVALGGMMEARRGKVGMRLSRRREAFLAAEGLVKGFAFIALPRRFWGEVGERGWLGEGELGGVEGGGKRGAYVAGGWGVDGGEAEIHGVSRGHSRPTHAMPLTRLLQLSTERVGWCEVPL